MGCTGHNGLGILLFLLRLIKAKEQIFIFQVIVPVKMLNLFFFKSYFAFPQHLTALTCDTRRAVFQCPQAAGPTPWLGTKLLLEHFFNDLEQKRKGPDRF